MMMALIILMILRRLMTLDDFNENYYTKRNEDCRSTDGFGVNYDVKKTDDPRMKGASKKNGDPEKNGDPDKNCDPEKSADPEKSCDTKLTSDQELVSNPCLLLRSPGTDEIYWSGIGFSEMPWIGKMFWVKEISWSDMILWLEISWFGEKDILVLGDNLV